MNDQVPEGWVRFHSLCVVGLCHSPGVWWRAPDGHEYCATCYSAPWKQQAMIDASNLPPGVPGHAMPAGWDGRWLVA